MRIRRYPTRQWLIDIGTYHGVARDETMAFIAIWLVVMIGAGVVFCFML